MATKTVSMNDKSAECKAILSRNVENRKPGCRAYTTVAILFIINLLNYMDRFTISAVLMDIQKFFNIDNTKAGLLHTSFIVSYMLLSPVFGYLGDRYSRKWLMITGVLFWSGVTLAGSFVTEDQYWLFLFLRMCVGVGEASYSTTAPSVIADLFVKDQRSNMLAIFYFALSMGAGLGYVVGARMAQIFGNWAWALRATPILGVISVLLVIIVVKEPERGVAEGITHVRAGTWCDDLKSLRRNKSYITASLGFTAVSFIAAASAFWMPTFMMHASVAAKQPMDDATISTIFGVLTAVGGMVGIAIGSQTAKILRRNYPNSDPLICAWSLLINAPIIYFILLTSSYNTTITWTLLFFANVAIAFGFSIVTDIILQVVLPTRRATAQAFEILSSHLLGGAMAPSLIGLISDAVVKINARSGHIVTEYQSLKYALYTSTFVGVLGAGAYFACALFVVDDKWRVENMSRIIITPSSSRRETMEDSYPDKDIGQANSTISDPSLI